MKNKKVFDFANKETRLRYILALGYRDEGCDLYCFSEDFFNNASVLEEHKTLIHKDISFLAMEFGLEEDFYEDREDYEGELEKGDESHCITFDEKYTFLPNFVFKLCLRMCEHMEKLITYDVFPSNGNNEIVFDLTSLLGLFVGWKWDARLEFVDYYISTKLKQYPYILSSTFEDGENQKLLLFIKCDFERLPDLFIDFIINELKHICFDMFCDYFEYYYGDLL